MKQLLKYIPYNNINKQSYKGIIDITAYKYDTDYLPKNIEFTKNIGGNILITEKGNSLGYLYNKLQININFTYKEI